MNKTRLIPVLAVLVFSVCALCVMATGPSGSARSNVAAQQDIVIPDHVPYMFLFRHHYSNLQKAAELERQGKDATFFRTMFKRHAALSDEQSGLLDQVTLDCEKELADQDAKAQAVISEFRSRYPGGVVPQGETVAPPPPELAALQQERNAIILRARDRLHAGLGESEFARFDSFVQSRIKPGVKAGGDQPARTW